MSTSKTTDLGDWLEIREGEPAWDNPAVWGSVRREAKPGTPAANEAATRAALVDQAMTRLTQIITQGNTLASQSVLLSLAQQKALINAVVDLAAIERRVIRVLAGLADGTD